MLRTFRFAMCAQCRMYIVVVMHGVGEVGQS